MIALEQIQQMSFREKLLVMEALWDELSRTDQELDMPDWHKQMLDERDRLVAEGKAHYLEWEDAKRQINERFQ